MSEQAITSDGNFYLPLRLSFFCLLALLQAGFPAALASDDQQPEKTKPIQASASVDWDIESGGTRSQGQMTVQINGTAVLAEYQGGGSFQLEEFNTAMTSGLNIRKLGSLVPKEFLAFAPPDAQEMMIDYYEFFPLAEKQVVSRESSSGW